MSAPSGNIAADPPPARPGRSRARRLARAGALLLGVAAALLLALSLIATLAIRASLPRETGSVRIAGLAAPVSIARDALGVPIIRGQTLLDVARAQGFIHAQERFFQMDLARRGAAGEIAELLGSGGLGIDLEARPLRFRSHANEVLARLPAEHRALLGAYTQGVNAGLADLGARPPEYWLLRASPAPWKEEDCILSVFLMFRFLNYTAVNEKHLGTMRDTLPSELVRFLTPEVTRWDTPLLVRDEEAEAKARAPMPIPGPEVIDLRNQDGAQESRQTGAHPRAPQSRMLTMADLREAILGEGVSIGSNNWAVSAARSKTGRAMVANDMHLGIGVPNTWFRVQLEWEETGAPGDAAPPPERRRAVGVSLPGTPSIVCGSNGYLAWGFTNVEADVQDLVIIEVDPNDPTRYFVPPNPGAETRPTEPFGDLVETIVVRGADPVSLPLKTTRWGVVTETDYKGRPLVLKWTALEPDKVNLGVFDMLDARDVDEGLATARRMFIPPQNVVMADHAGRIAWTVCGWLPERSTSLSGKFPHSWAALGVDQREYGWHGQIEAKWRPSVIDPPEGTVFTANNRTVGWPESVLYGNSWSPSDRASRIAEMLRETEKFDEQGLLAMQLDVRAEALERWRQWAAACEPLADETASDVRVSARLAEGWDGLADANSAGFAVVRAFQRVVKQRISSALTAGCKAADPAFRYDWFLSEEAMLRIVESRPAHLLPRAPEVAGAPAWADWDGFLLDSLREAVSTIQRNQALGLKAPWGAHNRLRAQHPLSRAVPFLGRWLDLPNDPLPGSGMTVRAQGRTFGASERFVVSPGREQTAIFHMPGGQSGHFLSRHYTDGHAAWVNGDPTPMLAGPPVRTLMLTP